MQTDFNLEKFIAMHVTHRSESLLAEDLRENDSLLKSEIDGCRVLVIGGAGSIGSQFVKAVLHFKPAALVVVDANENALTELVRDLRSEPDTYHLPETFVTYPMDFCSPVFSRMLEASPTFDIVANFAAHKHVRSEKDVYSISAMISNNVLNGAKLLKQLTQKPPRHFFCVSTDKAANPVNIMGASKKIMEEMALSHASYFPVTTARFANVAFSNGSLPLGFLDRLSKRQAIACPTGIKRFFVSPQESGQICLCAAVFGKRGEIFYPKLDPLTDMETFDAILMRLYDEMGLKPYFCTSEEEAHTVTREFRQQPERFVMEGWPTLLSAANTDGEKTYEEFFTDEETRDTTRFTGLGVILEASRKPAKVIAREIDELSDLLLQRGCSKADVVRKLEAILPNFRHISTGRSLDQKM